MSGTEIILKYKGSSVDDGSMPVEDMIYALKGFSSAYKKIIDIKTADESIQYRLRVNQIRKGSCDIVINAVEFSRNTAVQPPFVVPLFKLVPSMVLALREQVPLPLVPEAFDPMSCVA